jgi:hypothetical protein
LLSPANPQDYNPEAYLFRSFLAITAVILLFAVLWTILPVSDALRRRWYLASARAELRDLLAGRRWWRVHRAFRDLRQLLGAGRRRHLWLACGRCHAGE